MTYSNDVASFTWAAPAAWSRARSPFQGRITEIALTSEPGDDDTYAIGDDIKATVTFSEAVTVTGTPQIEMQVGGAPPTADYASGSGSTDLVFSYTIVEGDLDADGVAVEAGLIDLNGGTILVGTAAAGLSHGAVSASTDHKVDGVRPILHERRDQRGRDEGSFSTFSENRSSAEVRVTSAGVSWRPNQSNSHRRLTEAVVDIGAAPGIDIVTATSMWTIEVRTRRLCGTLAGNVNAASLSTMAITNNVPEPPTNAPPEFTSAASFMAAENQTAVGMVEATDEDAADTVSYAITGGADQAKFDIDASSGVLTFKDAPDHENPTDTGGNNTYMVTVTATGGRGDRAMTDEQTITVTVTGRGRAPLGPGPAHGLGRLRQQRQPLGELDGAGQQRQAGHLVLRPAIP